MILAILAGCADGPEPVKEDPDDWSLEDFEPCDAPVEPRAPVVDGGVVYEIYVRSFRDSDGDGFGDLAGVREKLPYLVDLGVKTIWLMPVFESPAWAGYDPISYTEIEEDYGTAEDFAGLVADASAAGIRVMSDLPLNHTSWMAPDFVEADLDPASPMRDTYMFSDEQHDTERWWPATGGGFYYAYFHVDMPDLNWLHAEGAHERLGMYNDWIAMGLGGYRMDAVLQLIEDDAAVADTEETHCLLAWLYDGMKAENEDIVLLTESYHVDVAMELAYLGTEDRPEADWALDLPRREALMRALSEGSGARFAEVLTEQQDADAADRAAPFLGSHDLPRLATEVTDAETRRLLMVAHLLAPGHPMLYYGEELDLADNLGEAPDAEQRGPMPWDLEYSAGFTEGVPWFTIDPAYLDGQNVLSASQDPTSLLSHVKALIALRNASSAATSGTISFPASSEPRVLAYLRVDGDEEVLVVLNFGEVDATAEIDVDGTFYDLAHGAAATGPITVDLPARGWGVFATEGLKDMRIVAPG